MNSFISILCYKVMLHLLLLFRALGKVRNLRHRIFSFRLRLNLLLFLLNCCLIILLRYNFKRLLFNNSLSCLSQWKYVLFFLFPYYLFYRLIYYLFCLIIVILLRWLLVFVQKRQAFVAVIIIVVDCFHLYNGIINILKWRSRSLLLDVFLRIGMTWGRFFPHL
jgi:hypothetical protein